MSSFPGVFEHAPSWSAVGIAVAVGIIISLGLAELLTWLASLAMPSFSSNAKPGPHPSAKALLRFLRIIIFVGLLVVTVPPTLEMFGQPIRAGLRVRTLGAWALASGLRVLFVVAIAGMLSRIVGIATSRFQNYLNEAHKLPSAEQQKRANTVGGLIRNVSRAFIVVAAAVMILDELHIDTKPLLASAGIVGLGLGFGAQTLVKDVISGFFLIVDNLIRIGDNAEINGVSGLVEAINLRTVLLRDGRGAVHVFPCGSVTTLVNLTKDYAYAVLDVTVAYRHDTDDVAAIMREVGEDVAKDPTFAAIILEPLEVIGIERLGDIGVTMRAQMKTLPAQQWNVARELRRRVKRAFDARGIQIPVTNTPTAPVPAAEPLARPAQPGVQ